jgi:NADH pyrophosphatase NudC (nudix superfamily)
MSGGRSVEELQGRRQRLSDQLTELQWDLGGVAYEMAIRDHFRLDVLTRQAAKLQQVDAELAEVERLLRLDEAGAAGACGSCGALYARGAVFCWQCGKDLMPRTEGTAIAPPAGAPG